MNRQISALLVLALAGLTPAAAAPAYGHLALSAPDSTHNRFTVTLSGALSDSDTSDVSGTLGVALDADGSTGATSAFSIAGGDLAMQDMSFSGFLWSLNTSNLSGTAATDSPPGAANPSAGGGTFSGALHRLIIFQGGISGSVIGLPVNEIFTRSSPLQGSGTGTGVLTVTPTSATPYHQLFNVVMTLPVDFTQQQVVSGQTVNIRVQGTLRATGVVAAPLYLPSDLATWSFDTGATSAERRAASGVPAGATVSTLDFNNSVIDFGLGTEPTGDNDRIGFVSQSADQIIFLRRANFVDATAPVGQWTSWGPGTTAGTGANLAADGNAPIVFTVTADALSTIVIDSLGIDWTGGLPYLALQFQEAGAAAGTPVFVPSGTVQNTGFTIPLAAPVVVAPGQTKTFSINLDSEEQRTFHYLDGVTLQGTVIPPDPVPLTYNEPFDAGSISPNSNTPLTFGNSATTSPWTATTILPSQTLGSWVGTNTGIGIASGSLNIAVMPNVETNARWRGVMTLIDLNAIEAGTYTLGFNVFDNAFTTGAQRNQMNLYRFSGIDADGGFTFDGMHSNSGSNFNPVQIGAIQTVGTGASFVSLGSKSFLGNGSFTKDFTLATAGVAGDYLAIVFSSSNLTNQDTSYKVDSVSISVANPYTAWALVNAPGQNPDQDFDADGVQNAVEFVLGGDKDTNDLDKLPTVDASGGNLTFSFERDQASIATGVGLAIEVSTDLADWSTSFAVPDAETAGPPVTVVKNTPAGFDTVTLTVTQTPDTKKFARLRAVVTP